jgi:hypothetical protein
VSPAAGKMHRPEYASLTARRSLEHRAGACVHVAADSAGSQLACLLEVEAGEVTPEPGSVVLNLE